MKTELKQIRDQVNLILQEGRELTEIDLPEPFMERYRNKKPKLYDKKKIHTHEEFEGFYKERV